MDIWLVACNLLVFGTLVEYCYAQVQLRKKQRGMASLSRSPSVLNAMLTIPTLPSLPTLGCLSNDNETSNMLDTIETIESIEATPISDGDHWDPRKTSLISNTLTKTDQSRRRCSTQADRIEISEWRFFYDKT